MRPNRAICITTVLLLLLAIQRQRAQSLAFVLLTERWLNEHNRLLAAALLRARNRQLRRLRRAPYASSLPRLNGSSFEIHYNDHTIPGNFFGQHLRMNRATFDTVLNTFGSRIVRENSRFRACLSPAKILAIGLYRFIAHGNSYLTIGPTFTVGKSTVIEAVQDVVGSLYELRDDHIKFPENLVKITTSIQFWKDCLPYQAL